MSLSSEFKLAAEVCFGCEAERLAAAQNPPRASQSLLPTDQELARLSPQPDRLVRVNAAASPLFEAASPLLSALSAIARKSSRPDVDRADELQQKLVDEVNSFQSICQDANIRYEYTLGASYVLCTAIDEAVGQAFAGERTQTGEIASWMTRSLAARLHGDSEGGVKVFTLLGGLVSRPSIHIDLLELMLVILRLGFEGLYRHANNGRRERENILHRVHALVGECRKAGSMSQFDHWRSL